MNVGVLASGFGSNLQALLDRVHGRNDIEIVGVGSDSPQARALERAREAAIPGIAFPVDQYEDRVARDQEMAHWLKEREVDLVVLAGYMQLLDKSFLDRFPGRVINVHPALLPAFPGLHAVQQAIDYGVKVFGVTVHFVDDGIDSGPVILQRAVAAPDVTEADAVLELLRPVEHELLPLAVLLIAQGAVRIDPDNPRRVLIGE